MVIRRLIWPADRVEHIARHGITPAEVEDVCFTGNPLVLQAKSRGGGEGGGGVGSNPTYYVLGRTAAGRYLFCVIIAFPDGNGYPVTARPMTDAERRRYQQRRSP